MGEPDRYLRAWLATFRVAQKYFRFSVNGFEHLRNSTSLIVGYHGGPWALDMFMLSVNLWDELGYVPRAFFLRAWSWFPGLRDLVDSLGGLYGPPSEDLMDEIKHKRQHIVVLPGGTREALRPFWRRHQLDFGARRGYLKMALRHQLPITPVASSGLDETFVGLNEGYLLSKKLFGDRGVPLWFAVGLGGVWPFALPWPARIHQEIGAPIDVSRLYQSMTGSPEERIEALHRHVTKEISRLLEIARR